MEIIACFKHIESLSRNRVRDYLASLGEQHIKKHLVSLDLNPVLHANVEREAHRRSYRVGLRLALGSRNLVVRERDYDLTSALVAAVESLERRVRRFLGKRRARRAQDKRNEPYRWPELHKASNAPDRETESHFAERVVPQLASLTDLVQRELGYLQAEDRLEEGYPTVTDILDDVLVRALYSAPSAVSSDSIRSWLSALTIDILADYVVEYRQRQFESAATDESALPLLDRVPLDDSWLDETLGLSGLELPVAGEREFNTVSRKDGQRQALIGLRSLPTRWRQVVWFYCVDELPISHIADAVHMSPDDVEAALDASIRLLREQMLEQGVESVQDDWPADYLVAPPALPDTEQIARELERLVRNEQDFIPTKSAISRASGFEASASLN